MAKYTNYLQSYSKLWEDMAKLCTATARFAKAIQSYARYGEVVQNFGKLTYVTEITNIARIAEKLTQLKWFIWLNVEKAVLIVSAV